MPRLYIITGPPGSGKTTYAKNELPRLPVFDTDLNNKEDWIHCEDDAILMTSAPSAANKTYWIEQAERHYREPVLLALWLPRMLVYTRMKDRSGLSPTERNDLEKSVERWFRLYSRHPAEKRIHPS